MFVIKVNSTRLIPFANKVLGKVMFLLMCVILFTKGLCPKGVSVKGGDSLWGLFTGVSLSRGFHCLVSLYRGWSLSRGSLSRESPGQRHPLYGDEREVRILLECFIVSVCFFVILLPVNSGLSLIYERLHKIGITNDKRQRFYLQMVIDIMEKNDGLERCLEDDFICSVQKGDDGDYIKKYVTLQISTVSRYFDHFSDLFN